MMLMINSNLLDAISMLHNLNGIHAGGSNFQANQTDSLTNVLQASPATKGRVPF